MTDKTVNGKNISFRYENSLWKTVLEPALDLITEMIEEGLGDKVIYETFNITPGTWFRYKQDPDLPLGQLFRDCALKKAELQIKQAREIKKVMPKKSDLVTVMSDLLYEKELDKLNAKEIDIIWNKLYPEDNFQRRFLEDKVEIARFEAETKRMALNNIFVEDEHTGELLTSFLEQFESDALDGEDYDDLLLGFTDEFEDEED